MQKHFKYQPKVTMNFLHELKHTVLKFEPNNELAKQYQQVLMEKIQQGGDNIKSHLKMQQIKITRMTPHRTKMTQMTVTLNYTRKIKGSAVQLENIFFIRN